MSDVDSLLRERQGYVVRNLPDRVRQVDEQLELHGVRVTSDALPPEVEAAVLSAPVERRGPGRHRRQ